MTSLREFSHTLAAYVIGVRDDGDRTQMRLGMKPTKAEQVCMDSLLEGTGFELAVPPRRESL